VSGQRPDLYRRSGFLLENAGLFNALARDLSGSGNTPPEIWANQVEFRVY
jgi:hypothetical protein